MSYILKEKWLEKFQGWLITGCAVRNNYIVYLCVRQDIPDEKASSLWDSQIPTRLVALFLDDLNEPYAHTELFGFNRPKVGIALLPKEQGLMSSDSEKGAVFAMGSGGPWPMEYIDEEKWANTRRLKCIGGYTYSVGLFRKIYKRIDMGKWVKLDKGLPEDNASTNYGFKDIDAFSDTDFYAVGGCGDVWHYDGDTWTQCVFPSNQQLSTVTCAPDGNVYIGGEGCSLWVGRGHSWQQVAKGGSTILWNETVWFQDKLWLSSDYELQIWNGKVLQRPMDGDKKVVLSGHIDARDGVLIVAGTYKVDMFDGQQWHSIVKPY